MFRGWKNVVEKLVKGPRDFQRGGVLGTDGRERGQRGMGISRKTRSRSASNAAVLSSRLRLRLALAKCRRFRRVLREIPIPLCPLSLPGY